MKKGALVAAVALAFSANASIAQDVERLSDLRLDAEVVLEAKAAQCAGGAILDDGTYENGLRTPFASDARYVQRFTPSGYPVTVNQVCACWKTGTSAGSMGFGVVAYDDNGLAGQPGTLLGTKSSAVSIATGFGQQTVDVACADLGINVTEGSIYLGAQWNAGGNSTFFLCTDESFGTPQATMYRSGNGGVSWTSVAQDFPGTKALGVRAELPVANPNACVPDGDTLCLGPGGRFKVEASYQTAGSGNGAAKVVKLTDDTGYLWFFSAVNVEAVVKIINACTFNNRYWVYHAGLTDQGVVVTVTDTVAPGAPSKVYTNPLGRTYVTITDSSAFATCP
jgi:hypothetical protein